MAFLTLLRLSQYANHDLATCVPLLDAAGPSDKQHRAPFLNPSLLVRLGLFLCFAQYASVDLASCVPSLVSLAQATGSTMLIEATATTRQSSSSLGSHFYYSVFSPSLCYSILLTKWASLPHTLSVGPIGLVLAPLLSTPTSISHPAFPCLAPLAQATGSTMLAGALCPVR